MGVTKPGNLREKMGGQVCRCYTEGKRILAADTHRRTQTHVHRRDAESAEKDCPTGFTGYTGFLIWRSGETHLSQSPQRVFLAWFFEKENPDQQLSPACLAGIKVPDRIYPSTMVPTYGADRIYRILLVCFSPSG